MSQDSIKKEPLEKKSRIFEFRFSKSPLKSATTTTTMVEKFTTPAVVSSNDETLNQSELTITSETSDQYTESYKTRVEKQQNDMKSNNNSLDFYVIDSSVNSGNSITSCSSNCSRSSQEKIEQQCSQIQVNDNSMTAQAKNEQLKREEKAQVYINIFF